MTITIEIPDAEAERLSRFAQTRNETLQELATDAVLSIAMPDYGHAEQTTVDKAIDYVLTKNHELYKRLA